MKLKDCRDKTGKFWLAPGVIEVKRDIVVIDGYKINAGINYRNMCLLHSAIMHEYKRSGMEGVYSCYADDLISHKNEFDEVEYYYVAALIEYLCKVNKRKFDLYVEKPNWDWYVLNQSAIIALEYGVVDVDIEQEIAEGIKEFKQYNIIIHSVDEAV